MSNEEATPSQSSPDSQEPKKTNSIFKELTGEGGLGGLFGNAHHGLGLIPVCFSASHIHP